MTVGEYDKSVETFYDRQPRFSDRNDIFDEYIRVIKKYDRQSSL
jgi:hypothetical protein